MKHRRLYKENPTMDPDAEATGSAFALAAGTGADPGRTAADVALKDQFQEEDDRDERSQATPSRKGCGAAVEEGREGSVGGREGSVVGHEGMGAGHEAVGAFLVPRPGVQDPHATARSRKKASEESLPGAARILKRSVSDAEAEAEKEIASKPHLTVRSKRRIKRMWLGRVNFCNRSKYKKETAVESWEPFNHMGMFLLSIIWRCLHGIIPGSREDNFVLNFRVGKRWASQCFLFEREHYLPADHYHALRTAVQRMHLHHPMAKNDHFHRTIKPLILGNLAERIQDCSFFLEFSFLTHWVSTPEELRRVSQLSPLGFADYCWEKKIVPITCRFGQSLDVMPGQKSLFSQLCNAAASKDKNVFTGIIVKYYEVRVIRGPRAEAVASILSMLPGGGCNRMVSLAGFLKGLVTYGDLSAKNIIETWLVHKVWANATAEELLCLPFGNGAADFLKWGGLEKAAALKAMAGKWTALRDKHSKLVVYNGRTRATRGVAVCREPRTVL